jgi:FkbH-like protein
MAEPVRLVIWDLDETFWRGTVTEGGIREYVQAHHEIVISLATRGILSSVCSKNDPDTIIKILSEKNILEYFVFSSISWDPKGPRLARLIEATQLRAPTVMFIDDNPANRAEAMAMVPGLQIEDETFIASMLEDPRFKGKDDAGLTRLKQYQLLEQRKSDETKADGDNREFLRSCDIRIQIEYDIESNIDRVVELVNRTNQLNYTKSRLPESDEHARGELRRQLEPFDRVAGLVRVADKYGDYGFVGFFMVGTQRRKIISGTANTNLIHFCFSCRTLGMLVEQWVYNYLNKPELQIVGEVLTQLSDVEIDWIREVKSIENPADEHPAIAPQIVLFGGCEANSIGVYLKPYTNRLSVYGNYVANGIMTRTNYAGRMLDISDRDPALIGGELETLGLPLNAETGDLFNEAALGTLFIVNFGIDATGGDRLRHKSHGWTFTFEPRGFDCEQMFSAHDYELEQTIEKGQFLAEEKDYIVRISRHIRANYTRLRRPDDFGIVSDTRQVIERIPAGSKLVILVEQELRRDENEWNRFVSVERARRYRELIEPLAAEYPYVSVVAIADCIASPDEIMRSNHYHRAVYLRIAQRIIDAAIHTGSRLSKPASKHEIASRIARQMDDDRATREAEDCIRAIYQVMLRREPEEGLVERVARGLVNKDLTMASYIRAVGACREFDTKWRAVEHEHAQI